MNRRSLICCVAVSAGLQCCGAIAQNAPSGQTVPTMYGTGSDAPKPGVSPNSTPEPFAWLAKPELEALCATVPPPPAPGSPVDLADFAAILKAQAERTPEIIAECKLDQFLTYKLFQPVYGSDLTPQNSPKFHQLMTRVLDVTRFVNGTVKDKYERPRPYVGHPDVVKSLFVVKGFSYPSGHSMASFTLAVALGEVLPDKKQAFLARAQAIAQSRVDAGVHYPSDIKAGEVLGRATGAAIIANATFQKELVAAKEELAGLRR